MSKENTCTESVESPCCAGDVKLQSEVTTSKFSNCCREQAVRERAYELWETAGQPSGDGVDFWLQAEAEVLGEWAEVLFEK